MYGAACTCVRASQICALRHGLSLLVLPVWCQASYTCLRWRAQVPAGVPLSGGPSHACRCRPFTNANAGRGGHRPEDLRGRRARGSPCKTPSPFPTANSTRPKEGQRFAFWLVSTRTQGSGWLPRTHKPTILRAAAKPVAISHCSLAPLLVAAALALATGLAGLSSPSPHPLAGRGRVLWRSNISNTFILLCTDIHT